MLWNLEEKSDYLEVRPKYTVTVPEIVGICGFCPILRTSYKGILKYLVKVFQKRRLWLQFQVAKKGLLFLTSIIQELEYYELYFFLN